MKSIIKKYQRGLFASLSVMVGGSDFLSGAYTNVTDMLGTVGLDWSTVIGAAVAGNPGTLLPYLGIAAALYIRRGRSDEIDVDALRAEALKLLQQKGVEP